MDLNVPFRAQGNIETGQLRLQLCLPGLKKSDIDVKQSGHRVRVVAKHEEPDDGFDFWDGYDLEETGAFNVDFPESMDPEALSVVYDAGILTLTMSMAEKYKPKSVQVE